MALGIAAALSPPSSFGATPPGSQEELSPALAEDATLRDLFFIDADRGWCVGDRGVILHTRDGGDTWQFQESGTTCRLTAVRFVDPRRGWAVGGWYEADTGLSRGVLLRTENGGQQWRVIDGDLPALHSLEVRGGRTLIAAGDWSPLHLSSVLVSFDAGDQWQPLEHDDPVPLRAVAAGASELLSVDASGVLRSTPGLQRTGGVVQGLSGHRWRATLGAELAAVVSDRGEVAVRRSAGQPWQTIQLDERTWPAGAPLSAVAVAGQSVWVAGMRGDRVVRIAADGSVEAQPLQGHGPLHALFFLDHHRGWAAGAYGAIWTTRDGGRSWRPQRAGNRRAMLLGVARDAAALPWPVLASESLESGYRYAVAIGEAQDDRAAGAAIAAVLPTADDPLGVDPLRGDPLHRVADVSSRLGGGEVALWAGEDADAESAARITAVLEAYQPSVVVLASDLSEGERAAWLNASVAQGVERVLQWVEHGSADLTLHGSAILPASGFITSDLWRDALAVLAPSVQPPGRLLLRRRYDRSGGGSGQLTGVSDRLRSSGAVRPTPEGRRRHLQVLQARSGEAAFVAQLIADAPPGGLTAFTARLQMLVQQTPRANRPRLMRAVLASCRQADRPDLYRAAVRLTAEQMPDEPLGRLAALRHAALASSVEWHKMETAAESIATASATLPVPDAVGSHRSPFDLEASAGSPTAPRESREEGSLRTEASGPDLAWQVHPAALMMRAAGGLDSMSDWDRAAWKRLAHHPSAGSWGALAAADPARQLAAHPVAGGSAVARPLLDGRLDDPCWRRDGAGDQDPPGDDRVKLWVAYDAGYLYLAARAPLPPPPAATGTAGRSRDANLDSGPRLAIDLDIDRDLMTAYRLEVDAQGRTRDTVDGFRRWHPIWYVATAHDGDHWYLEAAVRRQDLSDLPPVPGDLWNLRARVISPQTPAERAAVASPDGWQVLRFH